MNTPEQINNSGPAFPNLEYTNHASYNSLIRDYFAGQALNGYLATWGDSSDGDFFELNHVARTAYAYADAMLKAREVQS